MIVWGLIELAVSTVGSYNIIKGIYNIYCDAEEIKNQYRKSQKLTEAYKTAQKINNSLTESTFHRFEDDFLIINRAGIIDIYK